MGEVTVPAHVRPYVDALGVDDAVTFLLRFGGGDLHIGQRPNVRNPVAKVMGLEKAEALAAVSHRLPRRVPTSKPWLCQVLRSKGFTVTEIARKMHLTETTVRRHLKGPDGHDPNQLSFLD
ncbi:helix-turn-helix domain-containing protein [Marivita sp.]|uniref:helix-turn-helix domain-containing protein n=1 Tax=Marivita sp. TaxID=2003365 RepID=UPI003F6F4B10